ncbi:MAG: Transcriptional regulator, TetR family [Pseudonocardiales bacterium]|nr:Transcriptional regulator, TetR family [Pseudonocardiales bacterium]
MSTLFSVTTTPAGSAARPYHHGDLRNALVRAGVELAREGGPPAIVLREAARRVGVSANAAYRHFDDLPALVEVVAQESRSRLGRSMLDEVDRLELTGDARQDAIQRTKATGRGYIRFALAEPGLFALAFMCELPEQRHPSYPVLPGVMLDQALDEMLATGALSPETRPFAFAHAWAGVHGLSNLLLGPLADMPAEQRDAVIEATLDLIVQGLRIRP